MIINHEYKFCFFAIPRTASKALSKALVEQLGSEDILKMHISYEEFMEQASTEEKKYFTFTIIRNPLDSLVSAYFKKKNDHNGRFSRGAFKNGRPIGKRAMDEYNFITQEQATFSTYFKKFHQERYAIPRHEGTVKKVDHILRFEHLQADVAQLCAEKGWPALEIPVFNSTKEREKDFLQYYEPEVISLAIKNVGPLMERWGYEIPETWLDY